MPSPSLNASRLLERFLRYVRIDTTANPDAQEYPSSAGQWELGRMLVRELQDMGASQVEQDAHGLVWATIPANLPTSAYGQVPTLLFNAHLDTSPEASGSGVSPRVIENYQGGDIQLLRDGRVIRVSESPELTQLIGHCLVTTDGTTLLGGDDKAGVAIIMEVANYLLEHHHQAHGELRILFTCDEEIGRGARHVTVDRAAARAGYTLDGNGQGNIETENFSADQLVIRAHGNNTHPGWGKGRMVNAIRGLARLISQLPSDHMSPETTQGRDGFLHPYDIKGGVHVAEARILLRDFDTLRLDEYERLVENLAKQIEQQIPGLQFAIERQRQYRNMGDFIRHWPQVVELAQLAWQELGQSAELGAIRGGTDGAQFSEMGLPTPNLSAGQHNIHSVLEYVSLDQMVAAAEHLLTLVELWQSRTRS